MKARVDFAKVLMPKALKALQPTSNYVNSSGLDHRLLELVKLRTSQLNGCAYCIDMHSKDARAAGEEEQRLYLLDAWRETPLYRARARGARMDGGRDARRRRPRARRGVCVGARPLQRRGAGEPHHRHHRDQRLEPAEHRFQAGGRRLPAGNVRSAEDGTRGDMSEVALLIIQPQRAAPRRLLQPGKESTHLA